MEFGEQLKKLRESRGYSLRQLAMRSGVSFGQISKIENGTRGVPKPDTIEKLAKGLGVDYDYLMELAGYIPDDEEKETYELTQFLRKANVMFHGKPLTKEDKQRVEDVLTALFWHATEQRKKGVKKDIGSEDGEEDNKETQNE